MRLAIALGLALSASVLTSSCSTFGANLPPGAAGGSFLDEPEGALPFTPGSLAHKQALDAAARAHVDANIDVLMALLDEALALRTDLATTEKDLVAQVAQTNTVDAAGLRRI